MPTRAFLLCNDEKAFDAITQILGELEVSFEILHEPSLAAKRVAAQRFDLILADCDNEQHAIEVFTAVKKSATNQSSITIAVADGKNGVASAFRLGATLVLAKPVSMEQARGTLRNALAMARKSALEAKPGGSVHSGSSSPAPAKSEAHGTQVATPPSPAPAPKPAAAVPQRVTAPAPSEPAFAALKAPEHALQPAANSRKLGSTETLPLARETASHAKASKNLSLLGDEPSGAAKHPAPPTSGTVEKEKPQPRTSPFLLAALAIALVVAGVYAYSMMNPGFHSLLLSQYRRLQSLTGLAPKARPVAATLKPAPAPALPATPTAPAATHSGDPAPVSQTADGFASTPPAPTQGFQSGAPATSDAPVILNTSATAQKAASDTEPLVVPEDVADSHVAYRVQPVYPAAAKRKGVKGSVVLNASVDKDGNVTAVEVASGSVPLASAAVAAVKQWRYQAYYRNGQPAEFQTQVTIQFPQAAQP